MAEKLKPRALGYAGAVVAGLCMLLLGLLANFGVYKGASEEMQKWHMFFSLEPVGILTGIIEAAVLTFAGAYVFAFLYNKFVA